MTTSAASRMKTLIVIPCLNEAANIERLLRQLAAGRRETNTIIVVADGGSTDGTPEIVKRLMPELGGIALLDNPKRLQAPGINLVVERFGDGCEYLIRIDAHGGYPDDFCRVLLEEAESMGADSVVVGMKTIGFGALQKAAAVAQNSKLGNGGSRHRDGGGGEWVDHGHHALMRLAAFRAVGGYDESFSHNEDAELDHRLREAGFRIWMTGRTFMIYYPRSTLPALFRQYLGYGRGRARNLLKHRALPKIRQALPLAVVPAFLGLFLALLHWVAAVPFVLWASLCLGYGMWLAVAQKNPHAPLAAVSAMIMHFAWSAGFWLELLRSRMGKVGS
ncbi:glycosyltransferase family 2 protein [Pseudorhizobium endolithicum]|uniref:Glycosyltransferase family 2 protein n=1 Tax=Pseudorhizobium endolithicum TaxID=1191678 RepID=A0ABN7JPA8_9HYPH|nr:glycosyltransferase family 2 protein [Pseudorhizobium endolithicum]CAD6405977.1 succinoglycan biosynthesis protein exoa [Rhizobium sp. Q54]CAD7038502.1 glycosyltransferase family 2 protein [Pseudorhizobium endolithicum]